MADRPATPVAELSFEKALQELESIVQRLEQGKVDLEESIAIYERGEALKNALARHQAVIAPGFGAVRADGRLALLGRG